MTEVAVIDAILVLLLVATSAYCVLLTRRLKVLKEGQASLQAALATFDEASRRAESNLERMEKAGLGMGRALDPLVARGDALVAELSVMLSSGDSIAGRLENAVDEVRAIGLRRLREQEQT